MNIYNSPQCSCIFCKKEYSYKGIYTHYERSHGTTDQQQKYSNGFNGRYDSEEFKNKLRKPRHKITTSCAHCGNHFTYIKIIEHKERKTCSKSCNASFSNNQRVKDGYKPKPSSVIWTREKRQIASELSKKLWANPNYSNKILNSQNNQKYFTSKNERLIRDYFIKKYPKDNWTFGGALKIENEIVTRDLYSNTLKICFEYDGVWHFRNIRGQLERKRKKDILLEKWCIQNNFSLIRLDEDQFKIDIIEMLETLFYSIDKSIILKIGNRYDL